MSLITEMGSDAKTMKMQLAEEHILAQGTKCVNCVCFMCKKHLDCRCAICTSGVKSRLSCSEYSSK